MIKSARLLKGSDIEKIKADTEELTKPLYELTSAVYNKADAAQQQGAPDMNTQNDGQGGAKDEKVVDAEYKVVDDDKK